MSVEMRRHRGILCGDALTGNSRHVHVLRIRNAAAKGGGARHTVAPSTITSYYRTARHTVAPSIITSYYRTSPIRRFFPVARLGRDGPPPFNCFINYFNHLLHRPVHR